jgi:hypothetical protein
MLLSCRKMTAKRAHGVQATGSRAAKAAATLRLLQSLAKAARATKAKADRGKQRRLAVLLPQMRQHMLAPQTGFYSLGEALREVLADKLFLPEGHRTFASFLKAHTLVSRSTAFRLIRVVNTLSRPTALKLGKDKALALAAYAQALHADAEQLVARNARVGDTRVQAATTKQLVAATQKRLTVSRRTTQTAQQRARDKQLGALTQHLRQLLGTLGLTRLRYNVAPEHITVQISVAQLEAIARTYAPAPKPKPKPKP